MDDFFYGISTIGDLFPSVPPVEKPSNPWQKVANAFFRTGNCLREAMNEFQVTQAQSTIDSEI